MIINGVREYTEGYPVELVRDPRSGRLSILAKNEGGNNETLVDLLDVVDWLRSGPRNGRDECGFFVELGCVDEHNTPRDTSGA